MQTSTFLRMEKMYEINNAELSMAGRYECIVARIILYNITAYGCTPYKGLIGKMAALHSMSYNMHIHISY